MTRMLSVAAAIAASATLIGAAGGTARAQGPAYYVAVPEGQPSKTDVITRSTPWKLSNGRYIAARAPERDLVLCQVLVRNVGRLQSFSAGGQALAGDQLDKCNSRAKAGGQAIAAAR